MKVIITKVSGYTCLRKVGTEIDLSKLKAERYVELGIVKFKNKPRKKKSDGDTDNKDENRD